MPPAAITRRAAARATARSAVEVGPGQLADAAAPPVTTNRGAAVAASQAEGFVQRQVDRAAAPRADPLAVGLDPIASRSPSRSASSVDERRIGQRRRTQHHPVGAGTSSRSSSPPDATPPLAWLAWRGNAPPGAAPHDVDVPRRAVDGQVHVDDVQPRAPARTNASAAATGSPPNASTGTGPAGGESCQPSAADVDRGDHLEHDPHLTAAHARATTEARSSRSDPRCGGAEQALQLAEQRPRAGPPGSDPTSSGVTPADDRNRTRTGAPPGCASNSSFSLREHRRACTPPPAGRPPATPVHRAVRAVRRFGLAHLVRADLQLAAPQVDAARHEHDPVGLDQARHGLVDRGERDDVDAGREALQPELRVGLAALRVLARDRADDAADRDEVAVAQVTRDRRSRASSARRGRR